MRIVFFNHPPFLGSQSMPRFSTLLSDGMIQKGHNVENWTAKAFFYKLPVKGALKKWMGYVDQYILFPIQVKARLHKYASNTLFVFTDHALGPWVPLVANRPHVIHCHDFLAQQSAIGLIRENVVSRTGKIYQGFIHKGFSKGKNFVSVSEKTRQDLHEIMGFIPDFSEVVYNGLNQEFTPFNTYTHTGIENDVDVSKGYILHVGGNQWYKNRIGVIDIYNAWRKNFNNNLPLVLLGVAPDRKVLEVYLKSPYKKEIHFLTGKTDEYLKSAYIHAKVFLFPSLAEGFGWPIAEAMASGCPVITTGEMPMTEVAGDTAFLIDKRPLDEGDVTQWAEKCAKVVNNVITLSPSEMQKVVDNGIKNSKRFNTNLMLDNIERIYAGVNNGL